MRAAATAAFALLALSSGVGPVATPAMGWQATAAEAADPDKKIKCRKYLAPGSLVRKVKTCRTIAEWRKAAQAGNDAARYIVGENICSGGDCRGYEPPEPAPQ